MLGYNMGRVERWWLRMEKEEGRKVEEMEKEEGRKVEEMEKGSTYFSKPL
jgi:hypothetical protein